jgi:ubiquinone/menaquinone biosynthesis C-methylase UbiE
MAPTTDRPRERHNDPAPMRLRQRRSHPLFAAVYDRLTAQLEREVLAPRRAALLGGLEGDVLEVGAGTGASLPHFGRARRVVAAEPDPAMRRRMAAKVGQAFVPVEFADAVAEALPYPDASFDAVVFVGTLCTVADPDRALAEARRVLRPAGRLVALEHVRGDGRLARWQDRVTPLWSRLMAGCHPNRDTPAAIDRAGFALERIERFDPFPRWVPARPMIELVARPA